MKDRLLKFLNKEQLSSARFAEIIGVQPSSISHILSGRNKPGFDFIQKILINFPSLNPDWLIMGKGNMLRNYATQRDLFSEGGGYIPGEPEKSSKSDENTGAGHDNEGESTRRNNESEISDTFVTKNTSGNDYKSDSSTSPDVTSVNMSKSVSRIVIFYTDKSFDEYSPA
jgi:transcriptional regulator with XRE-family HTH domain